MQDNSEVTPIMFSISYFQESIYKIAALKNLAGLNQGLELTAGNTGTTFKHHN